MTTATLPARADVLIAPPDDWFALPGGHDAAYDVTIEADGRVHGYPAATWDTCHLSYQNECVTPPRSASGYAYFKVGSVRTASGALVATGPLTLRGGHADPTLSASKAMAFYDDTNSAFADVAIGEDEHGIWVAGAIRPETTPDALRAAMGSGFSGDWRWIGNGYELIALSAVNTPGFRRRVTERNGMVASMIVDMPRQDALTAAAGFSGVVIVALPEGNETITYNDGDSTEMHQTIVYLGTTDQLADGERDEILNVAKSVASQMLPFAAVVAGLGTLGEQQDAVAITEAPELQQLHDMIRENAIINSMYVERNAHPTWISHITAGSLAFGDEVRFDRIGAWFGGDDHVTFQLGEVEPVEDADSVMASAALRIAASIGRSPDQRIAALRARVHPDPEVS